MKRSSRLTVVGQPGHVVAEQLGGLTRKERQGLRIGAECQTSSDPLEAKAGTFDPDDKVPRRWADCDPSAGHCRHVRCRYHLWRVDGADRAGRRHGGRNPPTTLRAEWLVAEPAPSCALAQAELREHTSREIAAMLGVSKRAVEYLAKEAIEKLRLAGADPDIVNAMASELARETRSPLAYAEDMHATGKVWK